MFGHPHEPYDVQRAFMQALYDDLTKNTRISLFESPTGTGKTLSLLCPSISWLRDTARRKLTEDLAKIDASGGPVWMRERAKQLRLAQYEFEETDLSAENQTSMAAKRQKTEKTEASDASEPTLRLPGGGKIVFASRTHSQLAQVAEALREVRVMPKPRYVQLGSRQHLCVNKSVNSLKNINLINDKCAELQQSHQCPYRNNLEPLKQKIATEICDVEDLLEAGVSQKSCAYYAARDSASQSEVIALPYPLLLMNKTREALKLDLRDSVVIIDEAHNLLDALSSLHSQLLTKKHLERAEDGVKIYLERVGDRLSPVNRRSVQQIMLLVQSLQLFFQKIPADAKPGTPIDARGLLRAKNADTLDVPALVQFMVDTKLMFKVDSYSAPSAHDSGTAHIHNSLGTIMDFVTTAMDPLAEGKLFVDVEEDFVKGMAASSCSKVLRYLVLDSSASFKEIVDEAAAVVLAGGTMEPVSEFRNGLFPYATDAITLAVHTYGHIVPKEQLLVLPIGGGMKFTFAERGKPALIKSLGEKIIEIASEVPQGMVVFFPGYAYLDQVVQQWKRTDIWDRLTDKKSVFSEKRASKTDIFGAYSSVAVKKPGKGAILLAVVGGKLSEGINFSDDLARAVVMIGIPYPNAFSAEMVAKRAHIEKSALSRGLTSAEAKEEARQYYENLAMRQVNQSVGRAIRHKNDYAALYLIDDRFSTPNIKQKLSRWVRDSAQEMVEDNTNIKTKTHDFFVRNTQQNKAK